MSRIRYEKAPDVDAIVEDVSTRFYDKLEYINSFRVLCVRSYGSQARAYARIWSMPQVWKTALDIDAFYVLEVLHEHFDNLSDTEKEKTVLHELLHIPRTFSGALLPHVYGKDRKHIESRVEQFYSELPK